MSRLKPIHDRILVKRIAPEGVSAGGIVLPGREEDFRAEVVAVGPGNISEKGYLQPMTLKVGDIVAITKHARTPVKVDGVELLMMRECDVLGVIEADDGKLVDVSSAEADVAVRVGEA